MFDWITGLIGQAGYFGVFLLMLVENIFPPIPSELIMPLAGFTAAQGKLNLALVVLAGAAGSLLGALLWYYAGRWLGADRVMAFASRHGRWLTLSPAQVERAERWFRRHGGAAVFVGRLAPTVRTLISVPAGIAAMPLARFLAWTALGTALWTALLAGSGYLLESQYERVSSYLNPAANVVFALIGALYVYRVVTVGRDGGALSRGHGRNDGR